MARWTSLVVVLLVTAILAGCAASPPSANAPAVRQLGSRTALGKGTVSSYAELTSGGEPAAIGIVFSPTALDGLPESGSDHHHCVDRNKDGTVDHASECIPTFEHVIPLPDMVARRGDVPFKWVLLNWNPVGHIPPGIYDVPHFDIHFFMEPIANVFALRSGLCGPEFFSCDQFELAKRPVPVNYMHPDFRDVDAAVPAMGNHLIDLTGPEFNKQPFTRSWIYGVYGGRVTFYEEMVTRAHLLSKPQACTPIKSPKAVAVSGFYPTVSCLRYNATAGETTVSMEEFTLRNASPAEVAKTP
jgi:hypothetical protein